MVAVVAEVLYQQDAQAIVMSFPSLRGEPEKIASVVRSALGEVATLLGQHYENPIRLLSRVEESPDGLVNVHLLQYGATLRLRRFRACCEEAGLEVDVSAEGVKNALGLACYVFKVPLVAVMETDPVRDHILRYDHALQGGLLGQSLDFGRDTVRAHDREAMNRSVLKHAREKSPVWLRDKMAPAIQAVLAEHGRAPGTRLLDR